MAGGRQVEELVRRDGVLDSDDFSQTCSSGFTGPDLHAPFPGPLLESSLSLLVLRDLTELKAEHVKLSGSLVTCCLRLTVGTQSQESDGSGKLDGSEPTQLLLLLAKTQELEKEAHERSQELIQLKSQGDLEKAELQDR